MYLLVYGLSLPPSPSSTPLHTSIVLFVYSIPQSAGFRNVRIFKRLSCPCCEVVCSLFYRHITFPQRQALNLHRKTYISQRPEVISQRRPEIILQYKSDSNQSYWEIRLPAASKVLSMSDPDPHTPARTLRSILLRLEVSPSPPHPWSPLPPSTGSG